MDLNIIGTSRVDILRDSYKALFKETYAAMLKATSNEQVAESIATERVLASALLAIGEARRELVVIENIRDAWDIPLSTRVDISTLS